VIKAQRHKIMENPRLPLENMHERHIGLTKAIAENYLEAARVCLDRNLSPPQEFELRDEDSESKAIVDWEPTDGRCKNAWGNKDDATRDGAYACALAATELCLGMFAVRRAETLTGADYYIAPNDRKGEDLEDCLRLEVSGTDLGDYEVHRRLSAKINQAKAGKSNLPAIAAVVGFRVKLISMQKVEE
jgi:hypothetical protein